MLDVRSYAVTTGVVHCGVANVHLVFYFCCRYVHTLLILVHMFIVEREKMDSYLHS